GGGGGGGGRWGWAGDGRGGAGGGAYTLALDNLDGSAPGGDHDRDVVACMLAHATAFAAEAATLADSRQAAHLAAQSVDFAVHALRLADPARAGAELAAMRAELDWFQSAADERRWDDGSPVPPEVFAPAGWG